MELGLEGRVALVTGASKGMGRAIAAELAREGARVAVASRSRERIDAAASEIGAAGFVYDSGDLEAIPGFVREVEARVGPIEILVTNTGGPQSGPDPFSFPRDEWEAAHRELVLAPMALVEATLPGMRQRRFGRVLNVGSTTVLEPSPPLILSNVHRPGMVAAFKTLARAVAAYGVTLNTLLPGRIATDRLIETTGSREAADAMARSEIPAGRLGTAEEIAAAAAFLCSDRASYITGATLLVDGGLTRGI